MSEKSKIPEGTKIGKRFIVGTYLGGGAFGVIHRGKNIKTEEEVAIKLEKAEIPKPQLTLEFEFYKKLKAFDESHKGIPKVHYFGPCNTPDGLWSALIMDMLGPNLEKVHQNCSNRFSVKTTLMLGIQVINIFEYFHGKGLLFRDTKPENFLFGPSGSDKYSTVHIIDLGLSKEYLDENGNHIPFIAGKGVTGTVRYMSLNNHLGYEASRRDDLMATGYMLVYFAKSELPWMGVKGQTLKDKYRKIAKIKEKTKPEQLCADLPKEFSIYLSKVNELQFEDKPNYSEYKTLFETSLKRNGHKNDGIYDFDRNHKLRSNRNR